MLSDRDLRKLAFAQGIVSPFNPKNCEGATINLTLGNVVRKYASTEAIILGKEIPMDHYLDIDISNQELLVVPGESVLVHTAEFVKVPSNLSARVYERYSVKSLGLMISPAHYMNPGYRGNVGLLAINHSPVPIRLIPGVKICQIGFFELSSEPEKPYEQQDSKYMDATSASVSKLHLDEEIQEFLRLKGIPQVSEDVAKELGDHLMARIRESAKRLAEAVRTEEGMSP